MSDPAQQFEALYRTHFRRVLAYALRRAAPDDAADVVAETFVVAWRRLAEVPPGAELPWLYTVARHALANHRRGHRRRTALADRLRDRLVEVLAADPGATAVDRAWVEGALERLGRRDAEILRLSAWEGLEPREIAVVLDLRPETARARLSRARRRLRAELGQDPVEGEDPAERHPVRLTPVEDPC